MDMIWGMILIGISIIIAASVIREGLEDVARALRCEDE